MTTIERLTRPAAPPRQLPPAWRRVFTWTNQMILYLAAWFWGVVLLVAVVVLAIVAQFITPEISAMRSGIQAIVWFPFSLGVMFGVAAFDLGVTNGVTRAAIIKGTLATAAAGGLQFGLLYALLLFIERWAYGQLGWFHGLNDSGAEAVSVGWFAQISGVVLLSATAIVSGLLVGISYQRFGGWATLLLPLTVGPIVIQSVVIGDAFSIPWLADILPGWSGLGPVVALALLAAAAYAYALLGRRAVIHPKEAS